jgi:hypothetical protein
VDPIITNAQKRSGIHLNFKIFFLSLLILVPLVIYFISQIASMGNRTPLEAHFVVEPKMIEVLDEKKGINSKNYTKVFITYKNNTNEELTNLKVYIPKSVINDAGAGIKGFTDRKVGIDFEAARASGRQHIVLNLPDIKARRKQKVELVSFYSQQTGVVEIKGEIRTVEGLIYVANPASIVIN